MQNILFCAYDYYFLHNAYTLYSYMAQPYIIMLILKMHNMSGNLEAPNNTVLLHLLNLKSG